MFNIGFLNEFFVLELGSKNLVFLDKLEFDFGWI